ncbi:MAG: hypothetical protein HOV68_03530 [Streptomycetaceae bacterium]|nr:hypothetical protein [Streptomycetaceae bacterium]
MSRTVHVNALRWFAERDGGAEFVRSHGDALDDEALTRSLTAPYPDALQIVSTLRAAGVGADCWFTLADTTGGTGPVLASDAAPVSLGGLSLSVGGDRERIAAHVAVTGLTCREPDDEAITRAALALAQAFGPQVIWDDTLADVMLVHPDTPPDHVRTRWAHD